MTPEVVPQGARDLGRLESYDVSSDFQINLEDLENQTPIIKKLKLFKYDRSAKQ